MIVSKIITQTVAPDWMSYGDKIAAGGDSVLSQLSPDEFNSGLEGIRIFAEKGEGSAVVEPIDLFIFRKS